MAVVPIAAAFQEAFAHEAAGREGEAMAVYRSILAAVPNHPGALLRIAEAEIRRGEPARARERLQLALGSATKMRLPAADVLTAIGRLERTEGRSDDARARFEAALADTPMHAGAMLELGALAHASGDFAAAERRFAAVARRNPELGSAWVQLALTLERLGRMAAAREAAATAMTARQTSAAAWEHAARLAWRMHDYIAADRLCREGLTRYPRNPALMHQQGILLKSTGRRAAACQVLEEAITLAPEDAGLRLSLGATYLDAGRPADARTQLERALALGAIGGEAWDNLGMARAALGDVEGAIVAFEHAVAAAPQLTPALANLFNARQQACAWDGIDAIEQQLLAGIDDPAADPRLPPFIALAMGTTPAQQLANARRWARAMLPPVASAPVVHTRKARLRVGYVSSDFREHPTGRLMAGLFEARDRERFEIFAYSYGKDDASPLRARIRSAFDTWHDVDHVADVAVAQMIRDDGIDLLVDRKGLTRGTRLPILAERPAPVQVHYMSFPGTMGYDAIDGIIADADVIPPGEEAFFHERVWRLPRCYFINDSKRAVPPTDARAAHGLRDDALVLACFNQPYKLTRTFFAVWMEALSAAPAAVLWLLTPGEAERRNLQREAERCNVDPARLVFAPLLPQAAHMARIGCADLALDTLPVGQHATACDALWAGVPVLTCRGTTFVGRVGASILRAAELPELITESLDAYRTRLLDLVRTPAPLAQWRQHLVTRRLQLPLFDTAAFTRDWETLLLRIYDGTIAARRA